MRVTQSVSVIAALLGLASADLAYHSGEVKTYETFLYGKFEARMQPSAAEGTVTSLFTYWNGPNWTEAKWNEIDVEIVPSITADPFSTNLIYGDGTNKLQN